MSLNEFVEPTANTLVIDKAPGQTVDKYLADVGRKLDASSIRSPPPETRLRGACARGPTSESVRRTRLSGSASSSNFITNST